MLITRADQTISYSNGQDTVFVYHHGFSPAKTFALKNSTNFLWGIFDGLRNEQELLEQFSHYLGKSVPESLEMFMDAIVYFKAHKLIRIF